MIKGGGSSLVSWGFGERRRRRIRLAAAPIHNSQKGKNRSIETGCVQQVPRHRCARLTNGHFQFALGMVNLWVSVSESFVRVRAAYVGGMRETIGRFYYYYYYNRTRIRLLNASSSSSFSRRFFLRTDSGRVSECTHTLWWWCTSSSITSRRRRSCCITNNRDSNA